MTSSEAVTQIEGQTMQMPREQKDKQLSTKTLHKYL